jgi:hypothetical protein
MGLAMRVDLHRTISCLTSVSRAGVILQSDLMRTLMLPLYCSWGCPALNSSGLDIGSRSNRSSIAAMDRDPPHERSQ